MGKRLNWVALQIDEATDVGFVGTSRMISEAIQKQLGETISPASIASNIIHELNHKFDRKLNSANTLIFTKYA